MSDKPLSIRHGRFVQEYLKDGNATRAYVRAGYAPRGAQPCASRLLAQPHIEAAVAAGRQRLAQEYARVAFASVEDFVEVDDDGRLHIDLARASQAQRAGIIVLEARDHRQQEQQLTPKRGSPAAGLTVQDRERYEERCEAYERALNHRREEQRWLEWQLDEARAALAEAHATIDAAGLAAAPGPTGPLPDRKPDLYPNARVVWKGGRRPGDPPDSAEALRLMEDHSNRR